MICRQPQTTWTLKEPQLQNKLRKPTKLGKILPEHELSAHKDSNNNMSLADNNEDKDDDIGTLVYSGGIFGGHMTIHF